MQIKTKQHNKKRKMYKKERGNRTLSVTRGKEGEGWGSNSSFLIIKSNDIVESCNKVLDNIQTQIC